MVFISRRSYEFYSFILCLDSNITKLKEGSTSVYYPKKTYNFIETTIPENYVLFPAHIPHESKKITGDDNYKLALKLDFWLKINKIKKRKTIVIEELSDIYYHENYDIGDWGHPMDECNGYEDRW